MAYIAYIRVSTIEQKEARQEVAIKNYADKQGIEWHDIVIEKISTKEINKPLRDHMLGDYDPKSKTFSRGTLRRGDTLVVKHLDRLGRDLIEVLQILEGLSNTSIGFECIDMPSLSFSHDSNNDPVQKAIIGMFAVFSQLERDMTEAKRNEGIAIAKAQGKYKGRKPVDMDKVAKVKALEKKGYKVVSACREVGIGKSTYYRFKDQVKAAG